VKYVLSDSQGRDKNVGDTIDCKATISDITSDLVLLEVEGTTVPWSPGKHCRILERLETGDCILLPDGTIGELKVKRDAENMFVLIGGEELQITPKRAMELHRKYEEATVVTPEYEDSQVQKALDTLMATDTDVHEEPVADFYAEPA
jgi:hypothetical protein